MSRSPNSSRAAGRLNTPVVVIARYAPGERAERGAAGRSRPGQIDALFIPDQAEGMPAVAAALGVERRSRRSFWAPASGTIPRVLRLPQLQGAWFAAPDNAGFNAFAQRYRAKFNSEPTRLATLSYDAVSLAAALARNPDERFSQNALTTLRASTAPTACSGSAPTDERARPRGDGDRQQRRDGDQPGAPELCRRLRTAQTFGRLKRAWAADDTLQPQ